MHLFGFGKRVVEIGDKTRAVSPFLKSLSLLRFNHAFLCLSRSFLPAKSFKSPIPVTMARARDDRWLQRIWLALLQLINIPQVDVDFLLITPDETQSLRRCSISHFGVVFHSIFWIFEEKKRCSIQMVKRKAYLCRRANLSLSNDLY